MKKTKKALASLAIAGMTLSMIPFNVFAASPVNRIAGVTAEQTAVQIAEQTGYTGTAILASSTSYGMVDALTAGPLAASIKAPILLTGAGSSLDAATKAELTKLAVKKVYVTSGTAVIKQSVIDELKGMGIEVEALGGFDRAETSVNIAKKMTGVTKVAVANTVVDALSIAAVASAANEPILLTDRDALPASVAAYLAANAGITASDVIGGTGVISDAVKAGLPSATRHAGMSAYDTNNQVIQDFASSLKFDTVYVANGVTGIDALAGAPLAAQTKSPIVLTDGKSVPAAAGFTYSKSPVGAVVTALGGEFVVPESVRAGVAAGQVTPDTNELKIVSVSSLTDDGHVLSVSFSSPYAGVIDKSMVSVYNTANLSRVGVEKVELSTDRKSLEVTMYDSENDDEIVRLTEYTISVGSLKMNFTRPGYVDSKNGAVVTSVDTEENTIYVDHSVGAWPKTLNVPEGMKFDFEGVIGQEIKVWFDGDDNIINFALEGNTVLYDAIEVTETLAANAGEVELQQADKEYDLASDVRVFVNGEETSGAAYTAATTLGKTFSYAKLVLNDDGDVAFINAYDLDDSVVVESVDDGVLYGYDEDLDTEDFVIVKDGKQITAADIKKGDVAYYNTNAKNSLGEKGYIDVFNRTVTGEITSVYDDSFKVDGKIYDYGIAESLDDEGDIQAFGKDEADEMSGEVVVYLNRNGDPVFVSGDVGEGTSNGTSSVLTEDLDSYKDAKGASMFTLEYLTSEGDEESTEIKLKDLEFITIDGDKYKIDMDGAVSAGKYVIAFNTDEGAGLTEDAATAIVLKQNAAFAAGEKDIATADVSVGIKAAAVGATIDALDNAAVKVHSNDDGEVVGLEFFTSGLLTAEIEAGDGYAKIAGASKKLSSDTLVYDISDPDPEDIVIHKYSDINFDINTSANTFVYYDGNDVEYIVYDDASANDTSDISAVVTKAKYEDSELVYIKAYVDGEEVEYDVDELSDVLVKGDVVVMEYDEGQKLVTGIRTEAEDATFVTSGLSVDHVDLSGKKVYYTATDFYKLTSDCQVIDSTGTDYEVKALRDLDGYTGNITIVRDASNSGYVTTIFMY